jgi:hypothetical protein
MAKGEENVKPRFYSQPGNPLLHSFFFVPQFSAERLERLIYSQKASIRYLPQAEIDRKNPQRCGSNRRGDSPFLRFRMRDPR